jgi:hypothetical protein
MDFIYELGGINRAPDNITVEFRNAEGTIEFTPAALHVEERARCASRSSPTPSSSCSRA